MPKKKKKARVGRAPRYETPEELQAKIKEYFEKGFRYRKVVVRKGKDQVVEEIPVITISGLVLFCGFADRSAFYEYEKKPDFAYTIKRAREFIAREYEEILQANGSSAAIFALKNFGWTDRQEISHEVKKYYFEEFKNDSFDDLIRKYNEANRN